MPGARPRDWGGGRECDRGCLKPQHAGVTPSPPQPENPGRSIVSGQSSGSSYPGIRALVSYPGILAFACIRASGNNRGIRLSGHPLAIRALQEYPGESTRLMAMATGHGHSHGHWPWPLAMATGHGLWPWPLAMATGHGHWTWPLVMATGHGHWPWPLAMKIKIKIIMIKRLEPIAHEFGTSHPTAPPTPPHTQPHTHTHIHSPTSSRIITHPPPIINHPSSIINHQSSSA